jgi:phenylpropionate dioxygenase-like ring-hydroxylating dioxygenase large terminal subunit
MTATIQCTDPVALNAWHVVGAIFDLPVGHVWETRLLDKAIELLRPAEGAVSVSAGGRILPVRQKFGYVWTTLGNPSEDIFDIPEFAEPDRRNMNAASIGLHVSAPRVVENFLDLGHFAFVHTDYLGVEPHTEIKPYKVEIADGEVLATKCLAWQPVASLVATGGSEVDYVYRVPHPYCAVLYKSNAIDPDRQDVIAILAQPASEERVIAHLMISALDNISTDAALRGFQQLIFGQDKPILENQIPKRLPLSLRAEISARVDASSSAYRRWLADRGVRYGTIPA